MTLLRLPFIGFLLAVLAGTSASAQDGYRIQPGDVLRVEVIEDPDLNRSVLVAPDGRISLPLAGAVRASGRTLGQVQSTLAGQLSPNFAAPPNVFVSLERIAPADPVLPAGPIEPVVTEIFVVGEATNKGKIALEPGTTLLQAIAQFGGFTNFAATKRIQLRRGTEIYTINYDAILEGTSPNGAVAMREGDVIVVPQRKLFE